MQMFRNTQPKPTTPKNNEAIGVYQSAQYLSDFLPSPLGLGGLKKKIVLIHNV